MGSKKVASGGEPELLRLIMTELAKESGGAPKSSRIVEVLDRLKELLTKDGLSEAERSEVSRLLTITEAAFPEEAKREDVRDAFSTAREQLADKGFRTDSAEALQRIGAVRLMGLPGVVSPRSIPSENVTLLERGGALVRVGGKSIQFGSPPETVKDTMSLGGADVVVIDKDTIMNWYGLASNGEPEFPMYHQFFIKSGLKAPARFLTTADVAGHLDMLLRTSYEGPQWDFENADLAPEYPRGEATPGFPNMVGELKHFGGISIDKMRVIDTFQGDRYQVGDVTIINLGNSTYRIYDGSSYVGDLKLKELPAAKEVAPDLTKLYDPGFQSLRYRALFDGEPMVVPMTSSHGFDPAEGTSGHMIFNNGRLIWVDPPANALEFMAANHIPTSVIDGVILTHAHADHDQGTLKVLEANRKAKLYTTATIERMFMDKLRALSLGSFDEADLKELWTTRNVRMLESTEIGGLNFFFYHTLHANIAIGYNLRDASGKTIFSFSGDTLNDPAKVYPLIEAKTGPDGQQIPAVISSRERAGHIVDLPLAALYAGGVSIHESGVPPIHTPAERLTSAERVADTMGTGGRLMVYHVAEAAAKKAGLKKWGTGFGDPVELGKVLPWTKRTPKENILRAMQDLPVFRGLPLTVLDLLANAGKVITVQPNTKLIREGTTGTELYVVLDGEVAISANGDPITTRDRGIVGEGALVGEQRNATVKTTKPTQVFVIDTKETADLLKELGITERFAHLRELRSNAYATLSSSPVLEGANGDVVDSLLQIAELVEYQSNDKVIREGTRERDVFFLLDGKVDIETRSGTVAVVSKAGTFFGEMALVSDAPRAATVKARGDCVLLRFPYEKLVSLMSDVPSVRLRLMALTAERRKQNLAGKSRPGGGGTTQGGTKPVVSVSHRSVDGRLATTAEVDIRPEGITAFLSQTVPNWTALSSRDQERITKEIEVATGRRVVQSNSLMIVASNALRKLGFRSTLNRLPAGR